MTIEHIPPYVRGEPREYMTIKEFLSRYEKCELFNSATNYTRDIGTFWFELYNRQEQKLALQRRDKERFNLDVVFFGVENMECSVPLGCLFGAVEITLENELDGLVLLKYENEFCNAILRFNAEKVGVKRNVVKLSYIPKKRGLYAMPLRLPKF